MKILILTQYFPPEVGAPQNRLYELAIRLQKYGHQITVLTAMPNYPKMEIHEQYKGLWSFREDMNGLDVHRSCIYVPKSKGLVKRMLNYYSFVVSSFVYGLFKLNRHDVLIVESPPLFLGKTAWLLSLAKGAKMIFNVSDLWPESAEKLGLVNNKFFLWLAYKLEHFLYKKSWLITGQTQGIVNDIKRRFPNKEVYWLPNGVDLSFFSDDKNISPDFRLKMGFKTDDFVLLYAGIIGYAQGLEVILKAAELLRANQRLKFVFLGNGPEKEGLLKIKFEKKLDQVYFLDSVSKVEMPGILSSSDVAIIPLRKLDIFKGAIPSKIFENLAMKIPILLGVEGEAKELFIDDAKSGLFFEPENESRLAEAIIKLSEDSGLCEELGNNGQKYVAAKFERNIIAEKFNNHLVNYFSKSE
ncbi:MAG: glycosyltransferase family 4 protein [Bacteroidota bacterium]